MSLHRFHLPGLDWVVLSSIGGFLSLRDLANLSGTGRDGAVCWTILA